VTLLLGLSMCETVIVTLLLWLSLWHSYCDDLSMRPSSLNVLPSQYLLYVVTDNRYLTLFRWCYYCDALCLDFMPLTDLCFDVPLLQWRPSRDAVTATLCPCCFISYSLFFTLWSVTVFLCRFSLCSKMWCSYPHGLPGTLRLWCSSCDDISLMVFLLCSDSHASWL